MTREEPEIIDECWVEFYGDTILAVLAKIDGKLQVLVPVRPVCDVLGVDWEGQRQCSIPKISVLRSQNRAVIPKIMGLIPKIMELSFICSRDSRTGLIAS
jgi:hypothetical protein